MGAAPTKHPLVPQKYSISTAISCPGGDKFSGAVTGAVTGSYMRRPDCGARDSGARVRPGGNTAIDFCIIDRLSLQQFCSPHDGLTTRKSAK